MSCIKCGGSMIGDGYSSVIHCENMSDEQQANGDYNYAAPDEGPFYCDFEEPAKPVSPYDFNHSLESMDIVDVQFQGQIIGHIKRSGGNWAYFPLRVDIALSLRTLCAISAYIRVLYTNPY